MTTPHEPVYYCVMCTGPRSSFVYFRLNDPSNQELAVCKECKELLDVRRKMRELREATQSDGINPDWYLVNHEMKYLPGRVPLIETTWQCTRCPFRHVVTVFNTVPPPHVKPGLNPMLQERQG